MRPDLLALIPDFADEWATCKVAAWSVPNAPLIFAALTALAEVRQAEKWARVEANEWRQSAQTWEARAAELTVECSGAKELATELREALAEARRERDEARARVEELEADARMVAEAVMDGGWCSGEGTPDPDRKGPTARDAVATIREFHRFREEVWDAAESSGEDPALCDCPLCGGPPQYADGIRGLEFTSYIYCCHCRARTVETDRTTATRAWNAGEVHTTPGGDPASRVAGAPDAAGGASGVGVLTNCDSCVFARPERRGVLSCGSLLARMEKPGQAEWSSHHRAASGHPKPGATGCPGWAKRGEG